MFEVGNKVGTRSISEFVFVESDASVGVIEFGIIIIVDEGEDGLDVFFGEAGNAGEIADIGIVDWEFFAVAIFGGADRVLDSGDSGSGVVISGLLFFEGTHLFEDAHVFDIALVIFDFGIPSGVLG